MSEEGVTPTRQEAEEELDRILVSSTFATHPVPRALLARLVKDTLEARVGGKEYEHALGVDVLGKPIGWTRRPDNGVRQGLSDLRRYLRAYYGSEGVHDRVLIAFPQRGGFQARFSYTASTVPEPVSHLSHAFWQAFPDGDRCWRIVDELEKLIANYPPHAPSYAILAEAIIVCVVCDDYQRFAPIPYGWHRAEKIVKIGLSHDKNLWRLHVVDAAIYCFRFEWREAETAFNRALASAPEATRTHFWYAAFLLATGKQDQAEECIKHRLNQPPTAISHYIRPLFLYVTRDFNRAYHDLVSQSPNPPYTPETRVNCSIDGAPSGGEWLGEILLACITIAMNPKELDLQRLESAMQHMPATTFSGFLALLETSLTTALERGLNASSAISMAVAYTIWGEQWRVIQYLQLSCLMGHPLMTWLHLWPVFDPLRENEDFKALIKGMNLPQQSVREG